MTAAGGRRPTAPRTVISFWVRVPVLSVQMTVHEPRVSTDDRRLIRAWRPAIRCTPMARERVTVGSIPSGTKATIMPMREDEAGRRVDAGQPDGEDEEEDADAGRQRRHDAGDAGHLPLQRARGLAHGLGQVGDRAELGAHPGGADHRPAGAGGHGRPGEDQVGLLAARQAVLGRGLGRLAHGVRLAGQGGLVDPQLGLLDQPGVGRDVVALGQEQHVPGHQRLGRHGALRAVPQDAGLSGQQPAQGRGGPLRLVLLPEAEGPVDQVHQPDGHPELGHPGDEADGAAGPQQEGHQVGEVGQQLEHERPPPDLADGVGAAAAQSLGRLRGAEPLGTARQRRPHLGGRQGVERRRPGRPGRRGVRRRGGGGGALAVTMVAWVSGGSLCVACGAQRVRLAKARWRRVSRSSAAPWCGLSRAATHPQWKATRSPGARSGKAV